MAEPVGVIVPFRSLPTPPPLRELEIKFDVSEAALHILSKTLEALGGRARTRRLHSIYWDTDGGDLKRAGLGLRIREAEGERVQTVKAEDGGLFDRSEWEGPAADGPDLDLAPPLRKVLAEAGPLRPQFENRIERQERLVERHGARIELALDLGEVEAHGRRGAIRQLELELKGGDPAALFRLAAELAEAAPLRLTFETKAEQGYRLASGLALGAVKARALTLQRSMTVGQAFAAAAGAALVQVAANDRVVRQFRRPEAVHQMRVGLRRLRSAFALFRPSAASPEWRELRAELKWLADQLGPARDLDVFIATVFRPAAAAYEGDAAVAAFGKRLLRARTRAYDRVMKELDDRRAMDLPLTVAAWLEVGPWRSDPALADWRDGPVLAFAEAQLERLRRKLKRKAAEAETPEARHRLRIAAKKLRYGLDGFSGLFPEKAQARYGRKLAALQSSLGVLNDAAVARGLAMDVLGASATEAVFGGGLVVGLGQAALAETLAHSAKDLERVLTAPRPWRGT